MKVVWHRPSKITERFDERKARSRMIRVEPCKIPSQFVEESDERAVGAFDDAVKSRVRDGVSLAVFFGIFVKRRNELAKDGGRDYLEFGISVRFVPVAARKSSSDKQRECKVSSVVEDPNVVRIKTRKRWVPIFDTVR